MTDALYLGEPDQVARAGVGDSFTLSGDEGRHAVAVKRTRVGESILVSDGQGRMLRVQVEAVDQKTLTGQVLAVEEDPAPRWTWRVVQGLAKGERSDLALEVLTEVGVHHVSAWQSRRSIVKWDAKADKGLAKWQATAREAAKQSRRAWVPQVHPEVITLRNLLAHLRAVGGLVLVAHEEATTPIAEVRLPAEGPVTVLVGPEGGISPEELTELEAAGATPVLISEHVLRASTAGAVALVQLQLLAAQQHGGATSGATS
ncbi:16S rRNA (uracil(1498)-N(3))-methyltransferase [Propionibacteriaceae bacterium Y1923]